MSFIMDSSFYVTFKKWALALNKISFRIYVCTINYISYVQLIIINKKIT